ncbi:MAG: response regulator [Candidatus Altiarchaeota archaeon]|nr:response regulator [Candidatus Altiarchaeota archaeon]
MKVVYGSPGGKMPSPMPAHTPGGRKVRIMLVEDDGKELQKLQEALAAPHREITAVHVSDIETALKAFDAHDIVITDQDIGKGSGGEGQQLTKMIKKVRPQTVVIINSAFPMVPQGLSELEPDFAHTKGIGSIVRKGERKSPLNLEGEICGGYEKLCGLVAEIERRQFKLAH